VYSNYGNTLQGLGVFVLSAFVLICSTVLLSIFDELIKRRYVYTVIAFSVMFGFLFAAPILSRFANYLFLKRNEVKLHEVISEIRKKNSPKIFIKENTSDKFGIILKDLEIQTAQTTEDGSVIFMEGGFMEANGWCYSESGVNPEKYYDDRNLYEDNYERITFWNHLYGNWYRWGVR
jgi:uncharacterized membrane-anchored protein YitT (DUF2179 family)